MMAPMNRRTAVSGFTKALALAYAPPSEFAMTARVLAFSSCLTMPCATAVRAQEATVVTGVVTTKADGLSLPSPPWTFHR